MPGLAALAVLLGTIAAAFAGLLLAAGPNPPELPWAYVGSVVRFTLLQAALSTLLSLVLGAAVALALARRSRFPGRSLFIAALNLASVLPAIVTVFGIVAVFGRAGWVGQAARPFGIDLGGWLYGLPGILIAHVFFNAPLAARVFLASLAAVPGEHWRLAAQLGMGPAAIFRFIDAPLLKREAPAVAALIFLLCFTSFAVVLALGGGPRCRDAGGRDLRIRPLRRAISPAPALLGLVQVAICLAVALPVLWLRAAARRKRGDRRRAGAARCQFRTRAAARPHRARRRCGACSAAACRGRVVGLARLAQPAARRHGDARSRRASRSRYRRRSSPSRWRSRSRSPHGRCAWRGIRTGAPP